MTARTSLAYDLERCENCNGDIDAMNSEARVMFAQGLTRLWCCDDCVAEWAARTAEDPA